MNRWITALVVPIALAGTACSSHDAAPADRAPASQATGDDMADVTSYKLSMDKVDKFFQAQRNMALKMKKMTPAQQEALSLDGSGGMAGMAKRIESSPEWAAAIRDAGLAPREYVTLTMSLLHSAMAASMLQMHPNANQDSLIQVMNASKDNVTFLQQHQAEINAKRAAMEKELGGS